MTNWGACGANHQFSSYQGERKLMNHFVVRRDFGSLFSFLCISSCAFAGDDPGLAFITCAVHRSILVVLELFKHFDEVHQNELSLNNR
jgi:hypothetical protein